MGTYITCSEATLREFPKTSYVYMTLFGEVPAETDENKCPFIECDPHIFLHLIYFVRHQELPASLSSEQAESVLKEAAFLNIDIPFLDASGYCVPISTALRSKIDPKYRITVCVDAVREFVRMMKSANERDIYSVPHLTHFGEIKSLARDLSCSQYVPRKNRKGTRYESNITVTRRTIGNFMDEAKTGCASFSNILFYECKFNADSRICLLNCEFLDCTFENVNKFSVDIKYSKSCECTFFNSAQLFQAHRIVEDKTITLFD